jgi:hypothetical protein
MCGWYCFLTATKRFAAINKRARMENDQSQRRLPYPTLLVHADDRLAPTTDVAPALHPSTTYCYPLDQADWHPVQDGGPDNPLSEPVYSRLSYSTTERAEKVLGDLMGGTTDCSKGHSSRSRPRFDVQLGTFGNPSCFCSSQSKESLHFSRRGLPWHKRRRKDHQKTLESCNSALVFQD